MYFGGEEMGIRFCFFDLYFTLFDPIKTTIHGKEESDVLGISSERWEEACAAIYNARARGQLNHPRAIVESVCTELGINATTEQIDSIIKVRLERFERASREVDSSIITALRQLKKEGVKICLISNADFIDKMFFHKSPVAEFFDHTIFSYDVGHLKPEPEIYKVALKAMNALPSESMFIGDGGHHELRGAKKLGFKTVLTTYHIQKYWSDAITTLEKDADVVVNDLRELIGYL